MSFFGAPVTFQNDMDVDGFYKTSPGVSFMLQYTVPQIANANENANANADGNANANADGNANANADGNANANANGNANANANGNANANAIGNAKTNAIGNAKTNAIGNDTANVKAKANKNPNPMMQKLNVGGDLKQQYIARLEQGLQDLLAANSSNSVKEEFFEAAEVELKKIHQDSVTRCKCKFVETNKPSKTYIFKHWKKVHKFRYRLECIRCKEAFFSLLDFPKRRHKHGQAVGKSFRCCLCLEEVNSFLDLKLHCVIRHFKKVAVGCSKCAFICYHPGDLYRHHLSEHGPISYTKSKFAKPTRTQRRGLKNMQRLNPLNCHHVSTRPMPNSSTTCHQNLDQAQPTASLDAYQNSATTSSFIGGHHQAGVQHAAGSVNEPCVQIKTEIGPSHAVETIPEVTSHANTESGATPHPIEVPLRASTMTGLLNPIKTEHGAYQNTDGFVGQSIQVKTEPSTVSNTCLISNLPKPAGRVWKSRPHQSH